ncbi:hypothetical protein [Clostridium uliginosum]|uniref:Uncharacterized protein n=1 Tax=Clostridium uliginosum TaxID=119641 RepID=A0A1I1M576_9CLOT|nr:hypothetical protein [Clostridium uliginosum]SFC80551.1 hypothetical protein SAMN05421842_11020 [Clostridium uliginosum]
MVSKDFFSTITVPSKNILRDKNKYTLNYSFDNSYSSHEFSNLVLNSNLENGNMIK